MHGFIQLPFRQFCSAFPSYVPQFKETGYFKEFYDDKKYVVRLDLSTGAVEIGYPSDPFKINSENPFPDE